MYLQKNKSAVILDLVFIILRPCSWTIIIDRLILIINVVISL
jgi:hypothetical protein